MALRPLRSALEGWRPATGAPDDPLLAIALAWPSIVGPRVAANSAPLELRGETLHVATRSSAWSQQLQLLSHRVLEGLHALALKPRIESVRFKSGLLRAAGAARAAGPAVPPKTMARGPAPLPARDEREALENLRRRIARARAALPSACAVCNAPLDAGKQCAPCASERVQARQRELERLMFSAPWLDTDELRALVAQTTANEIERVRRGLLVRWWAVLERARKSARPLGRRERQISSSYVLLQSGLPPDRITPEVVRNVLGDELEARLSHGA